MGGGYGMPCFYAVLGVARDASAAAVRAAYRREALKCHPDKLNTQNDDSQANARFQQIQKAYEVLSDASKRAAYDAVVFPSVQPELPRPFQRTPTVDSYGEMLRDLAEKTIQQALWIREHSNINMDEVLARLEGIKNRCSSSSASRSDTGATSSAGPQEAVIHGAGGKQSTESSSATSHRYSPFGRKG